MTCSLGRSSAAGRGRRHGVDGAPDLSVRVGSVAFPTTPGAPVCWMCSNPESTFADYVLDQVQPVIDRSGWAVQAVGGPVPLAYTVGLTAAGGPELVVSGKDPEAAYDLLDAALAGEEPLRHGRRCDLMAGPALLVLRVARVERLEVARFLYGGALTALQLVWADALGRWPWEHPPGRAGQELLGPWARLRAA